CRGGKQNSPAPCTGTGLSRRNRPPRPVEQKLELPDGVELQASHAAFAARWDFVDVLGLDVGGVQGQGIIGRVTDLEDMAAHVGAWAIARAAADGRALIESAEV